MADLALANELTDPETYGNEARLHEIYSHLRANDPVSWMEPEGYRPYWAVTKYADIMEISRQNEQFLNAPRLTLLDIEQEEEVRRFTGGSDLLLRTLVNMDMPDHKIYRNLTLEWFQPKNLNSFEERVREIAKVSIDKMADLGGECDFASDIGIWYPLHVIMMILGVPEEDEPMMLKLTQELFGSNDPDMQRKEETDDVNNIITDFFNYFGAVTADRRANPKDDLSSVIANAEINGQLINDFEAISYYVITATAGHDTTSSTSVGGLLALMENPDELAKLKRDPSLIPGAIDEMIRWVAPVQHFFRTAKEDYVLRGQEIKADEGVVMFYASGNRDEEIFDDPFKFKIDRSPNRHLAFGYGAHLCLGQFLAKLEMRVLYEELIKRLDWIELAGEPARTKSSFVSGLKSLPVHYKMN